MSQNENRSSSLAFHIISKTNTVHGFQYIGDKKASKSIKIFWIISFILSVCGFLYYADRVYYKWSVSPDIVLKKVDRAASEVPFPALTICPLNKILPSNFNFTKLYNQLDDLNGTLELPDDEKKYFEMSLQLCYRNIVEGIAKSPIYNETNLSGSEMLELMKNQTKNFNFGESVLTSEGYCETMNLLNHSDIFNDIISDDFDGYVNERESTWSSSKGYKRDEDWDYPKKIKAGLKNSNIQFLIYYEKNEDPICSLFTYGFRIYIHMPNELPGRWHQSFHLKKETSVTINLKAVSYGTGEDLLTYSIDQRRCIKDDENFLKFFKSYTKSNCELECWTNYTLNTCGCVNFFMPREQATQICNLTDLGCAYEAENVFNANDKGRINGNCTRKCLKACNYVEYVQLIPNEDDFDANRTLKAFGALESFYENFPGAQPIFLMIQFEDFIIKHYENFVSYKIQNFVSDCGGLLGLFMGGSILSLVEICFNLFSVFLSKKSKRSEKKAKDNNCEEEKEFDIKIE